MIPDPGNIEPAPRGSSAKGRRASKAILDPVAMALLTSLALAPATAAEVGERLGLRTDVVRRHLRKLSDRGQVTAGARVRRRGRLENLYFADLRATVLDPADLAGLPGEMVAAADLALARAMFREAAAAVGAGIFSRHTESTVIRFLAPVDDRDLPAAVEIHRRLLDEVVEEAERARARIDRDGVGSIATAIQILCFEHPIERWQSFSDEATVRRRPEAGRAEQAAHNTMEPFRRRILDLLGIIAASAGSLADLLEIPQERVRYELDRLLAQGMVRVIGTKANRGAVERVFVSDVRGLTFSKGDLEAAGLRPGTDWEDWVVRSIFGTALGRIGAGGTENEGGGLYMGRVVAAMDAQGFARIATLTGSALAELSDLRDRSLESREEGVPPDHVVLSGLLAFERVRAPGGIRAGK